METSSMESRIILALQAFQKTPKLSLRKAAILYNIPASTLCDRRAGKRSRRDIITNSKKLTETEE